MDGKNKKFEAGDLVFAKMRLFPAWPAQVTAVHNQNRIEVVFFGDYKKAVLTPDKMTPYCEKTRLQFDVESSRRRPKFKEGISQIAEAFFQSSPELIASQMNTDDMSAAHEQQEISLMPLGSVEDNFDRILNNLRSSVRNLKKSIESNPTQEKVAKLNQQEIVLTTLDLKLAASIDDPDLDLAFDLLHRLASELLPVATPPVLLNNPDTVEVIALLTKYNGNCEKMEIDEPLKQTVEVKLARIREVARIALGIVKNFFPSLYQNSPEVWTQFASHSAHMKAVRDPEVVPSSLTPL